MRLDERVKLSDGTAGAKVREVRVSVPLDATEKRGQVSVEVDEREKTSVVKVMEDAEMLNTASEAEASVRAVTDLVVTVEESTPRTVKVSLTELNCVDEFSEGWIPVFAS